MTVGRRVMHAMLNALSRVGVLAGTRQGACYEMAEPLVQRIDGGFVVTFISGDDKTWARFVMPDEAAYRLADQIVDGLARSDGGIHD